MVVLPFIKLLEGCCKCKNIETLNPNPLNPEHSTLNCGSGLGHQTQHKETKPLNLNMKHNSRQSIKPQNLRLESPSRLIVADFEFFLTPPWCIFGC